MQMNKISTQDYCRNFVRDTDYNLYLLNFFAPRDKRPFVLTIMALHCELRLIPKKVHDPMLMQIRLQWWRDEIDKIKNGDGYAPSPILDELRGISPLPDMDQYFNNFTELFAGKDADIDSDLYELFAVIIDDKQASEKFSKILMRHDVLQDKKIFRALRLWLNV